MALDTEQTLAPYEAPEKDLYEMGEMPPLGHVPKQMYAWAIRRDRQGAPDEAMQVEVVFWDERLTTVAAERSLTEMGRRGSRRREVVDQSAATILLQGFLDANT